MQQSLHLVFMDHLEMLQDLLRLSETGSHINCLLGHQDWQSELLIEMWLKEQTSLWSSLDCLLGHRQGNQYQVFSYPDGCLSRLPRLCHVTICSQSRYLPIGDSSSRSPDKLQEEHRLSYFTPDILSLLLRNQ